METETQPTSRSDFECLVRSHQAGVWRYLRFIGAGRDEADDLTQETFLVAYRNSFVDRTPAQTATYLRTVARRQLLLARRRTGRELNTTRLDRADQVWKELAGDSHLDDYLAALALCLDGLMERAQQAIRWSYGDGLSRQEISQRLEMQPDGVKTLLRRARADLRACVERKVKP